MKTPTAATEQIWEERRTEVAGTSTRYLESGRGTPVLLLHGEGSVSEIWSEVLEGLADTHRVVAVDLPGFGHTEKLPHVDAAALAAFVWKFAQALGMRNPSVVGHSLGAAVAVHMALQQPSQVPALVLVSSSGMGRVLSPVLALQAGTPLGDLTALVPRLPLGPQLLVASSAVMGACRPWRVSPAWFASQVKSIAVPETLRTTLRLQRSSVGLLGQRNLLLDKLSELRMPTLVVWGTQDRLVPFWQAFGARRRLGRGRLKLIGCCGHLVPQEAAGELLSAVRPFLARAGDRADNGAAERGR
ncbi:alpha/beta hydrolase [Streptomyces sp. NPDC091272]|uniref:alpha/beta hydrolase n=1 Tax=Streptomyces sp. NPDC091272 TaxID=3365981 RepID=UPI003828D759